MAPSTPYAERLEQCLDDLERRIDVADETRLHKAWNEFLQDRFDGDLFTPRRADPCPPEFEWPAISVNEGLADLDAMALQQYAGCSGQLAGAGGAPLSVRANYGTSIMPSLFGAEMFYMSDASNTLPTTLPVGIDRARALLDAGVPDLRSGQGALVLEMGERFRDIGRRRPKIGEWVQVYHPDTQGPLDVCELLLGSALFNIAIEDPDLLLQLLELVTETYIAFMRAWERVIPFRAGYNAHWGLMHRGTLMLRDDSAMNLSPDMFDQFVKPYDERLLCEFGGGAIHFCGRGDHFISRMAEIRGLYAINLSQPELNDMETIYSSTVDRGIMIVGLSGQAARQDLEQGRRFYGRLQC